MVEEGRGREMGGGDGWEEGERRSFFDLPEMDTTPQKSISANLERHHQKRVKLTA